MGNEKKNGIPEGFTPALAVTDALPVLLFGAAAVLLGRRLGSPLFIAGALAALWAGAAKVAWKCLVVFRKKDVRWLFWQMRIVMPAGFLLMIAGIVWGRRADGATLWAAAASMPSALFFALGLAGMCLMTVFAVKCDSRDAKANQTEQLVNTVAQACFLAGIALMRV